MTPLALLLAALVGLLLGVLGGGGSVLAVPVLIYVAGYDPRTAAAVSLAVVGSVSFVGAMVHWRAGNLQLRLATPFALASMLGSYGGAYVAQYMPHVVQLSLLGGLMIAGALVMKGPAATPHGRLSLLRVTSKGLAVGVLTGLVGVGGGFMVVPALLAGGGFSVVEAVATSLGIIALNSLTGFLGYMGHVEIPWWPIGQFLAASILGMGVGLLWARTLPQQVLKKALALLLLVIGAWTLIHTWLLKGA